MAEKTLWRTSTFYQDPPHQPSWETVQEISKVWKTISNTKAALRHTEYKLDVAPTSSATLDPIMDTKRAGSSATRKISRKDGRYHEDSNAHHGKHSHPAKSGREGSSRSPLRATTLDSNVKSSCRVGFREPLASYREVLSSEEKSPGFRLKNFCQGEKDFDSTRSSAVDETTVRYLNDRSAIDSLHWQLHRSQSDLSSDYRDMTPTEPSQHHPTVSPLSNRLETLKKRQPDAKLEKLKERIRRQWELSEERDNRERLPETKNVTDNTNAKTRKVTSAPPAPSYRGFNPPETKIRTPDGKVWQEAEFQNLSVQLHGTLPASCQEGIPSNEKSQAKRTSRPVRKVQRLAEDGGASPDGKTGHIISTSSWRDGQKLIKQILGPAPKVERESKSQSNDRQALKVASSTDGQDAKRPGSKEKNTDKRTAPSERQKEKRSKSSERLIQEKGRSREAPREDIDRLIKPGSSSSHSDSRQAQKSTRSQMDTTSKNRNSHSVEEPNHEDLSTEVKKDFLPLEIRGILDDLQLDSSLDGSKQTQKRSHSPTKRKSQKRQVSEEPHSSSKRRHYDSEQVRLYIMRQQEERKKKQNEQRAAQRQAEEQKNKRLQELYQKQREAFSKAKNVAPVSREKETEEPVSSKSVDLNLPRPQDTYSKLLLGETWPPQTEQGKQIKPLYQPSGESDKENKGQERPPSASSSSDLSLSEPLQPLLRSDLMEAYCPQPDKLAPKGTLPQSQFLALPKDLESLLNPRKNAVNMFPASQRTNVQFKTSSDFKSNLNRIESLKATAMSLSSRIENEAKKLAGGSLTLPIAWSSEPDLKPLVRTAWQKPDSPPEKESRVDAFSNRIQKMLSTCSSHFSQDDLPGASHLYRKLPEELPAHPSASLERYDDKEEKSRAQQHEQSLMPSGSQRKATPTPNSSTSSISEGPILSEDSFSEGEGQPRHASLLPPAETLKSKEYCIKDYKSFAPLAEFQREANKYSPLASNVRPDFQGSWEELTKGSTYSVINIFTRTLQQQGRDLNGYEENEPGVQSASSAGSPQNSLSYADDFISSQVSESATDSRKEAHQSEDTSASSAKEELTLVHSRSDVSPQSSRTPSAASSPLSASSQRGSTKRKVWHSNNSPLSVKVEQNSSGSENKSQGSKRTSPVLSASKDRSAGSDSDSTMGDVSFHSMASLTSDTGKDLRSQQPSFKDVGGQEPPPSGHQLGSQAPISRTETGQSAMRFSPAGLHQRLSAELNYLGAMEESVRQLCDVERVRGISLAQQETVSLAQILKAQQQRHEQNMAALRQQAEQEAQESMRQLEEARQIAAKTQAEMLQRFQKSKEPCATQNVNRLHEEPDRGYLSPASSDHAITSSDQEKQQRSHAARKKGSRSASPSSLPPSSVSSFIERSHSSSSEQDSQPASSIKEETASHRTLGESISEDLPTPDRSTTKDDVSLSIDEKGASSAEPRNEDGNEELSFRSLLPSEAHRRGSLERQRSRRHESDEESTPEKEVSGPFSSGQDSFWKFTMEMVRQYMQEGEMRSAHQAALLRLRQKALKDKTKAELAWLEHQKRRLRDKGEDDKMPPLRKRQRGLLLRLQQEQAEIKRLQEANKAARRERQLILKHQEEIQRIQNSTLRLQEKLKSAESGQLEQPSEGDIQPSPLTSHDPSDAESRSPSPVSVSGSETSSIMQKLRKMHSHMDAKDICPVHCFFSVFTPQHWASLSVCFPKLHPKFQLYICRHLLRFLTKREQQLVQRRLHAQELLEWKRRLDAEELEIRQIEKQALAAWDNQRVKNGQSTEDPQTVVEDKRVRDGSSAQPSPTIQTRTSVSPPPEYLSSESIDPSTIAEQIHEQSGEHGSISEELSTSGPSKMSPPRTSKSPADFESSKESIKAGRQKIHITLRPHQLSHTWSEESLSMTHSEATSDQSDIEGRIRALKEELKKRKSVVENLKREQRRRQKERLRAQEAILLQQLQSYDEYIQKTQAELSGEQGTVPSVKGVQKPFRETVPIGSDSFQRTDSTPSDKAESEHIAEISSRSRESTKPEKSVASRKEDGTESVHDKYVPFSAKEDSPSAVPPSPTVREALLSAQDSPASSIQSEIPEDMLDAQSYRSVSPLPALDLKILSETPEENVSPHRDLSYSEDFETSTAFKYSMSETPREELDVSYSTTPGRDIPGEGFYEQEDERREFKSPSPTLQAITELKPPSQEIHYVNETSDPLAEFKLGDRVLVSGVQPGTLRFKGETLFADGVWAGVELDKAEGNNDGSLGGSRYFVCSPLHGIFAPPQKIALHLLEEHEPPVEDTHNVETSLKPKEQFDDETPLIDDFEPNGSTRTPLKSTESSVSESHSTLIEQELQEGLPTDTPLPDEGTHKSRTPLLEQTEKYSEARFKKRAPEEVSTLTDSLLQVCLKDTVSYLQSIQKQRAQKIQQSNQELHSAEVVSGLHKEGDASAKQNECQKLLSLQESFGENRVTEFEPSRNIFSILGDEPDWFDEDFGLSSRKSQQLELERALSSGPVSELQTLASHPEPSPKSVQPVSPPEPIFAVPHTVAEVEQLVEVAADKLWEWKQLSGDLEGIRNAFILNEEEESLAYCAYKEMLFDLTLYIFEEVCSPDPRGSQPPWKKPLRVTPSYSRRVRDHSNIKEVKAFLTSEVLNLLNLRKEDNPKTDWQRMMKFGRKKRDRVDHILVQELHEEEAQWVNYDEDELFVKMQLADGIFEALIRDTIQVLQGIQNKKNPTLHV
ncbi:centrosome-associated protein 350 isoform X1 [Bufo bufo]|uniref:centrosome-associated protein 350 isoform X1 n=1 Tax=Bufo bufo TaxID=8384 RepID=UPI001ABE155A|nr:centrosome-associated protein 350 isoform X1 [Bufo bufo]